MVAPGGQNNWTLTSKPCDSCKTTAASLFCHTHSSFLCLSCDSRVHKAVLRHARIWLCDVCEQAPAIVKCKADAASLCATCDRDIHSANPLAKRHERVAVVPFYDSPVLPKSEEEEEDSGAGRYLSDSEEAASWLLPNPNLKDEVKPSDYLFSDDVDPYLDLDLMMGDQKPPHHHHQYAPSAAATTIADGVVPVVPGKFTNENNASSMCVAPAVVEGVPCYDVDYAGSKPFLVYNFNSQSTQTVSSSSLEVGVVPDHNTLADVSTTASLPHESVGHDTIVPLSRIDREARVMRYREKRKNRKFEKTIRYASRKAYAETRPRIKGRFAKRTDTVDVDVLFNSSSSLVADAGYDRVPSF